MTIRVTDVHLANVPAMLVGECGGHALSVDFVDVVVVLGPLPRPPWAPWQRKISDSPAPTAPKIGGVPQSQHFFQPHFLNQAKLAAMSDRCKIGVMVLTSIWQGITRGLIGNEIFLMNEEAEGGKALSTPV